MATKQLLPVCLIACVLACKTEADSPDKAAQAEPSTTEVAKAEAKTEDEPEAEQPAESDEPAKPDLIVPESTSDLPLREDILAWAEGSDAILSLDDDGIYALTVKRERQLLGIHYDTAHYDIVWFVSARKVYALDLTRPSGPPIEVVDKLPEGEGVALPDLEPDFYMGPEYSNERVVLRWKPEPRVELGLRLDEITDEDLAESVRAATIVDKAWLESLAERSPRELPDPTHWKQVAKAPTYDCHQARCRQGPAWLDTDWTIYVSSGNCNTGADGCFWNCALIDEKTGYTADPEDLPEPDWDSNRTPFMGTCQTYFVNAKGTAVVIDDKVCSGKSCFELRGEPVGFLEPGASIISDPDQLG